MCHRTETSSDSQILQKEGARVYVGYIGVYGDIEFVIVVLFSSLEGFYTL